MNLEGFTRKTGNKVGWICAGDEIKELDCLRGKDEVFIGETEMEIEMEDAFLGHNN